MAVCVSNEIKLTLNGVSLPICLLKCDQEAVEFSGGHLMGLPIRHHYPRITFSLPYVDKRWMQDVLGQFAIVDFSGNGMQVTHEAMFTAVRWDEDEGVTRISMRATFAPPLRVRSRWFHKRLSWQDRYNTTYLGIAADWHAERNHKTTEKKIRAEIERIEKILAFKPPVK